MGLLFDSDKIEDRLESIAMFLATVTLKQEEKRWNSCECKGKQIRYSFYDVTANVITYLIIEVINAIEIRMNILQKVTGWLHFKVNHRKDTVIELGRYSGAERNLQAEYIMMSLHRIFS